MYANDKKVKLLYSPNHILSYLLFFFNTTSIYTQSIGGIMVSVLVSNGVDREFEPQSGQTKDYEIRICCFSVKHETLRRKTKDWLARNQNNVSEFAVSLS
jgi:hypothetical protein